MPDRRRLQPLLTRIARHLKAKLGREAVNDMAIPAYTRGSALSRWVFWRKLHWIERLAASKPGERTLDFGCGTGVLLPSWSKSGSKVYATDLRLSFARILCRELKLVQVTLFPPDELESRIPDATLDLVVAANVLEHVQDRVEILRMFGRKLNPCGRLVISGPSENALYRLGRWMVGFPGDYHVANVQDVFADAVKAGFRARRIKRWPLPALGCLYEMAVYERVE